MSVYKRGDRWYYDFMIENRRYRKRVPAAQTKHEAENGEADAIRAVYQGTYGRPTGATFFAEFVEKNYLPVARVNNSRSFHTAEVVSRILVGYFHDKTLADINPLLIERFKRDRLKTPAWKGRARKPATVNLEIAFLSRILSLAVDQSELTENPCTKVKRLRTNNARTRYLSREEEQRLMPVLDFDSTVKSLTILALNTGMRRGELLKLRWSDVDLLRNIITVRNTKSNRDRPVPINADALAVFTCMNHSSEWLFPAKDNKGHLKGFDRSWHWACAQAEITDLRFHDLRHTAATRLAEAGCDAFTIAAILGHSQIQMSARYTHVSSQRLREAVEKLASAAAGGAGENDCLKFVARAAGSKQ